MKYENKVSRIRYFAVIFILMTVVLSACAKKGGSTGGDAGDPEDAQTTQDMGVFAQSGEIGARIEEYIVPAPDKSLAEMEEEAGGGYMMLLEPTVYKGGFFRYAVSSALYCQFFSFETKKWTTVSMDEKFEIDGVAYDGILMLSPSGDGQIYCRAYKNDAKGKMDEVRLAQLGTDYRVGTIGPDCTSLLDGVTESDIGLFLDSSGKGYLYQKYRDAFELRLLDENMQLQDTEKIQGILGGLVENPVTSQVYWYGTDQEGRPVMGQPGGGEDSMKKIPGLSAVGDEEEEGTSPQEQQKLPGMYTQDFYVVYSEAGDLYVVDRTSAYLIGEQEARPVLNYMTNGYILQELYGVSSGPGRSFRLLVELDGELTVLTIDPDYEGTLPVKREIQLAIWGNAAMDDEIAIFNRRSSEYRVTAITPENSREIQDFERNLQMEISAGGGPDLIATNVMSGMDAYLKNGYLECLDEKMDVSGVLPAVLEEGKRDGKIYGVPYEFSLDFAAYRRSDVGNREFITTEDFLGLVRSSGAKAVQELAYAQDIVVKYALWDRSNKAYIDWEKRESHLTEQPFLELLEFAGKYGYKNEYYDSLEAKDYFAVGHGHGLLLRDFVDIKRIYEELDGEAAMLGYPATGGGGIYLTSEMLCVNSNSACKEGEVAFLNFLLTEEAQTRYAKSDAGGAFPVNGAALEAMMKDEKEREEAEIKKAGASYAEIPYAEDAFDQFRYLVRNARTVDEDMEAVVNMVCEEVEAYFSGDKSAKQVVEILDSRVGLYLSE